MKLREEQSQRAHIFGTSSTSPTESRTQIPVIPPGSSSSSFSSKKSDSEDSKLTEKEERKAVCPALPHIKSHHTFTQTPDHKRVKLPQEQTQHAHIFGTSSTSPTESPSQIPVMPPVSASSSFTSKKSDSEDGKLKEKEER
ncbi:uncharacterized protein PS065_002480 [Dugong dugon]